MAQSLDQIIAELDASYNPSRQSINDRINGLQPAQDADLAGLEVQKQNAFGDITNGARARGMGFSGIPLAEQGKYVGGTFLPAVAKVKQSYQEGRNSLVDALNNMNIDQRKTAMSIRETQQDRDFQAEQARLAREASERAARAAAGGGSLASLLGGGGGSAPTSGGQAQAAVPKPTDRTLSGGKSQQDAYNQVQALLKTNGATIRNTLNAIQSSARKGNTYDQAKLQIINSLPQFKQVLANFNGASF